MKAPTVHIVTAHVDIYAVEPKENDSSGSGAHETAQTPRAQGSLLQKDAPHKQKQVTNQKYNQESQGRSASTATTGEVKRTSIETFPYSDELPSADDLPLGDLGRSEPPAHALLLESSGMRTFTLTSAATAVINRMGYYWKAVA